MALRFEIQEKNHMYPSIVGDCTGESEFKKETFKSVPVFSENARISVRSSENIFVAVSGKCLLKTRNDVFSLSD